MSKPRLLRLAPGKVSFFCEDTRLHLTLMNPIRELRDGVQASIAITNGIKGETLIDVNKNILGGQPVPEADEKPEKESKIDSPKEDEEKPSDEEVDDVEDTEEDDNEEKEEKPKTRRRTRKKSS